MKKAFYFFVFTLLLISCTKSKEPWEKDPLNLDIEFIIESSQNSPSIIAADISDRSIGTINVSYKEEKPNNLPFKKEFLNQKVNFYTDAVLSYKDRSDVKIGVPFSEYNVTLKILIDGKLKKEKTFLIKSGYDNISISYSFEELFFD